jgi:hypothetical protein
MDDIISHGAYTVATYTDEVFSQADRFLNVNMIGEGGVAADDFGNNEDNIAANSENNKDLEDATTDVMLMSADVFNTNPFLLNKC